MSPVKKVANKPNIIEEKTEEYCESMDIGSGSGTSGQVQSVSRKQEVKRSAAEGIASDILNIVGEYTYLQNKGNPVWYHSHLCMFG